MFVFEDGFAAVEACACAERVSESRAGVLPCWGFVVAFPRNLNVEHKQACVVLLFRPVRTVRPPYEKRDQISSVTTRLGVTVKKRRPGSLP